MGQDGVKGVRVHDLASAITAAQSLIEFKDSSKGQSKKIIGSGKVRGDWDKRPKWHKPSTLKEEGKGKKDETSKKISWFFAIDLTKSSSVQSGASLLLLSRKKRGMRRK